MKTTCAVTRPQFAANAKPLTVNVNGQQMLASVKEFSTGSFGWYLSGKTTAVVDGKTVTVQVGMNMTVVGSKEI